MENIIYIKPNPKYPSALISCDGAVFNGVIGKSGSIFSNQKQEGDDKTPIGSFKVRALYYRADRVKKPNAKVPVIQIETDDIWVDDPVSEMYNQPTKLGSVPEGVSYEKLWREDHLYDIFLDLDYNRKNTQKGMGSAIFMHLSRDQETPANKPTAGCIALKRADILEIIKMINNRTTVKIMPSRL